MFAFRLILNAPPALRPIPAQITSPAQITTPPIRPCPRLVLVLLGALAFAGPLQAQTRSLVSGGDLMTSGAGVTVRDDAARDVVAMGASVSLRGRVAEDAHAMGFDVDVDGAVGGDLTAAGFSVSVDAPVAGDITAAAMTLRLGGGAEVGGNARLAGATVSMDSPVLGAVVAAGGEVTLDAPVSGDALLIGQKVVFGPNARVDGVLTYSAPEMMDIPARVASPDRVRYEALASDEMWREARDTWRGWDSPPKIGPGAMIGGFLVSLGFLVIIGALFLTLMPRTVRRLRRIADDKPWMVLLTGIFGLSALLGIVPVSAMTVLGLPLVPVAVLAIVVIWTLGYILGAYVLAMRVLRGIGTAESPGIAMRLLALVIGVTLVSLLNFIPVIGWMANFALVLLGIGAISTLILHRFVDGRLPAVTPAADEAGPESGSESGPKPAPET